MIKRGLQHSDNPRWKRQAPRVVARNMFRVALVISLTCLLSIIALTRFQVGEPARVTWFVSGGLGLLLIFAFQRIEGLPLLSPPVAYSLIFWVFHFGLVFPASVFPVVLDQFAPWDINWIYYPEGGKATLLSLLFLAAFLLGELFTRTTKLSCNSGVPQSYANELIVAGHFAVASGILLAIYGVLQFGFSIFFRPYEEFFRVHNTFSWAVVIIAFGYILQIAGGKSVSVVIRNIAWTYAPLALLTLVAGARTAPLFSAVVVGIALTFRGFRLPRSGLWVSAVIMLLAISLVRETRQYGLSEVLSGQEVAAEVSPLSGMTEMGGSLRPVATTVHYIDVAHNQLLLGQTYVYPLWRQVQRVLGIPRSDPMTDPRFIANHISLLYSAAMGYSVVAEGYANLGTIGVLLFALVWGASLGVLERYADKPYGLAFLGAVLLPMMINIRNSFIFVPAWVFLGGAVILFARFILRGLKEEQSNRPWYLRRKPSDLLRP